MCSILSRPILHSADGHFTVLLANSSGVGAFTVTSYGWTDTAAKKDTAANSKKDTGLREGERKCFIRAAVRVQFHCLFPRTGWARRDGDTQGHKGTLAWTGGVPGTKHSMRMNMNGMEHAGNISMSSSGKV